ncbi:hypothetical protein TNCV_575581 [Trichonephila clavipes]|nr:hypothetical protein TNCV_575581 [Trichonephila clavipes]
MPVMIRCLDHWATTAHFETVRQLLSKDLEVLNIVERTKRACEPTLQTFRTRQREVFKLFFAIHRPIHTVDLQWHSDSRIEIYRSSLCVHVYHCFEFILVRLLLHITTQQRQPRAFDHDHFATVATLRMAKSLIWSPFNVTKTTKKLFTQIS